MDEPSSTSHLRMKEAMYQRGLISSSLWHHVSWYQEWLKKETPLRNGKIGYSITTMSRKIIVIKSFLKWLHEVGYIKIPLHTAFLNNEVRMKDRPDRDLSYEEVKALIDHYRNHSLNHALLTLLATTGLPKVDGVTFTTILE
jgi:integrase